MERLRDYTKKVARQLEIESALTALSRHCFSGSKPRRFISGIAVSSRKPNSRGTSFVARGVDFTLPTVLLWNHQWERALGLVTVVETRGDQVRFKAEIANDIPWADQIWEAIIAEKAAGISIEGHSLLDPVIERTFMCWRLAEISVVQQGADHGAVIEKVWEDRGVVFLDGRSSKTIHWELPR